MPTRVLVADDHLAIREGIRSLLAPDDELLVVGEAADGVQASRMALELKPDLILLDNSMPGKTGLEVARELKPLLPDASIVFLTLDPGIRDLALAVGAVAHISKDTAPQETLRILRQIAQQRAKAKPAELTAIERTLAGALVEEHLFTTEQMARLVASRGPRETLAAALLRTGTIPDMRAAQVLSRVSGKPLVTFTPYHDTGVARLARGRRSLIDPIDPTVAAQLAKRLCEQRHVVLVKLGRSEATLAMAEPARRSDAERCQRASRKRAGDGRDRKRRRDRRRDRAWIRQRRPQARDSRRRARRSARALAPPTPSRRRGARGASAVPHRDGGDPRPGRERGAGSREPHDLPGQRRCPQRKRRVRAGRHGNRTPSGRHDPHALSRERRAHVLRRIDRRPRVGH